MPSYRHHDFGNLYIQFEVKFPEKIGPEDATLSDEDKAALERILGARKIEHAQPPADAMVEDFPLENIDPTREHARARGAAGMDDDDDDMHGGAERVQCASQ